MGLVGQKRREPKQPLKAKYVKLLFCKACWPLVFLVVKVYMEMASIVAICALLEGV